MHVHTMKQNLPNASPPPHLTGYRERGESEAKMVVAEMQSYVPFVGSSPQIQFSGWIRLGILVMGQQETLAGL